MSYRFIIDPQKYKVLDRISSGTFGKVCSIENKETHQVCAAKIILNNDSKQNKTVINREIEIMAHMRHPTIIKFYGYSLIDFNGCDNVTIFMQLATNGTLAELICKARQKTADKKYDNTARQKILIGIARGMMFLHQHNVIHRDLKPLNVLLDENLEPLITDFGLSKFCNIEKSVSQTLDTGTSIYMAPEIIDGNSYSGKVDVYSFGILMYEVVTDMIPYPDLLNKKLTLFSLNSKVLKEDYRPEFRKKIKAPIQKLIERCWSGDPHLRPTFNEIFNLLAYNIEDSVYDIYENNEDDNNFEGGKYYLEGVDSNEILSYADKIKDDDNSTKIEIESLKKRITKLEEQLGTQNAHKSSLNEGDSDQLENQIREFKQTQTNEIHDLREIINQMRQQITSLINENTQLKQQINQLQGSSMEITRVQERDVIEPSSDEEQVGESTKPLGIAFSYDKETDFNGIINYIKTHSEDINEQISITSSTQRNTRCSPINTINYSNPKAEFCSKEEDSPWICFDFKEKRVIPKGYIIRSCPFATNGSHPKSWVIEGSNDGEKFDVIDNRRNCPLLNGKSYVNRFPIQNPTNQKYQYLKMRLIDVNWYNRKVLNINNIEFYGQLI